MKMNMSSFELAEYVGGCWGGNSDGFTECFSENGIIEHPYFTEPVTPTIAMQVLNSTCRVTTKYNKCTLLEGDGSGKNDLIRMEFIETGDCAGYTPKFAGNMIVDAWVINNEFVKFKVYGYDVVLNDVPNTHAHLHSNYEFKSLDKLLHDIAESWTNNNMDKFISFFTKNGKIYHPIISKPASPQEIADIINSGTKGLSIPKKFRLIKGVGDGENDIVDLYFEETGEELGYIPDTSGLMHVTVKINNGLIDEMLVHGYTPIKNNIGNLIYNQLFSEKKVKENNVAYD